MKEKTVKDINKQLRIRSIILGIIGFLLVFFGLLKRNSSIAEWFTRGIDRGYFYLISFISKYIPFSLTELYYVAIIVVGIVFLVFIIKALRKNAIDIASKYLLNILIIAISTVCLYNLTFSFAYNRKSVDLPFYKGEVENKEFVDLYNFYADDLNECIASLTFLENGDVESTSFSTLNKKIEEAYHILDNSSYFTKRTTYSKRMLSSFLYTELNITGVTFAPLGEANVNYMTPNADIPFCMAHEIAHTKGVAREDEANQVAFYVLLNSDDPILRYSAYSSYFYQIRMLNNKMYLTDEELEMLHPINNQYFLTQKYIRDFWKSHTFFKDIGDFFNDLYIKLSGVKEGTASYSGGTDVDYDKEKARLYPSRYQQLYLEKYYRLKDK